MTDTFTPRTPSNAPATESAKRKRVTVEERERGLRVLNIPRVHVS